MNSNDSLIITYADLKHLFLRYFTWIKYAALICGLLVCAYLLQREPVYVSEATFKQTGNHNDVALNVKEIFQQILPFGQENGIYTILRSNEVLRDTVETLGLQAHCNPSSALVKRLKNVWENFFQSLPDLDQFNFVHVSYDQEKPLILFIKLNDDESFQVFNKQKKLLAEGSTNQPIHLQEASFTLTHIPKKAKINRFYALTIEPWLSAASRVRSKFEVRLSKFDKNIFQLSFFSRDRVLGAGVLNQIMLSYQKYLKKENEELYQAQLAYLHKRQQELVSDFDRALSDHVQYLAHNLGSNGFIGFAEELETLSVPKNLYTSKLFDIDVELKRFLSVQKPVYKIETIQNIQQKRYLQLEEQELELQRTSAGYVQPLLQQISETKNLLRNVESDFSGLSLDTAQKIMIDYTQQRDKLQAEIKELVFLRERLSQPDFELSSLGTVINEPVTNDLIQKASTIALQLKDSDNRSDREQGRLLEALKTQKSFLAQYILQTVELKKLRSALFEDKIGTLHQRIVHLLKSEKDLLSQKLQDINAKMSDLPEKWRRESLLLLEKEIGATMIHGISQLTESKFLGQNIFQVASKPLDIALIPTVPKPSRILPLSLIAALLGGFGCYLALLCKTLFKGLPVSYENLKLSGFPICGTLTRHCTTDLSQMPDTDLECLRYLAEFLSPHLKKGLALTAICLGGNYPDYSRALAEILSMRGLKVLVIQYVFDQVVHPDQRPGLWQYLNSQDDLMLPIRRHLTYDYLPSGGTSRHGADLVNTPKFSRLLSELKPNYDLILMYTSADAARAEGLAYLNLADVVVVTAQREQKEDLQVYCNWAHKKNTDCTRFIYSEEFS